MKKMDDIMKKERKLKNYYYYFFFLFPSSLPMRLVDFFFLFCLIPFFLFHLLSSIHFYYPANNIYKNIYTNNVIIIHKTYEGRN